MRTQREAILLAIQERIASTGLAPVYRSRTVAFVRNELPAVVVKPGGEKNERIANHLVKRTFQVLVEVHARASSEPGRELAADQVADPVIAALHAAVFAEKTLGGLIADLFDSEMQEPQFADGDETAVGITLVFEAVYGTKEADITHLTNH